MRLCGPDTERFEPREGGAGGGRWTARRKRREKSKTKDNTLCNLAAQGLCSAATLFGDLDKGIITHFIGSVHYVCAS